MATANPYQDPEHEIQDPDDSVDSGCTTEVESSNESEGGLPDTVFGSNENAPGRSKRKFRLHGIAASGPSRFFNPTNVRVHFRRGSDQTLADPLEGERHENELAVRWQSRDNRKGRNPIAERPTKLRCRLSVRSLKLGFIDICKGTWRMLSTFPYWDMSWYSGWSYTFGSILFVIDGVWSWGPLAFPSTAFPGEAKYGDGLCFFFGALLYQIGATMAYLEAINDGSFQGSAMNRFLQGQQMDSKKMVDDKLHAFFGHLVLHYHKKDVEQQSVEPEVSWLTREQSRRPEPMLPSNRNSIPRRGGIDLGTPKPSDFHDYSTFRWYPTWNAFHHHHIFEIGFVACTIQLFGATLYAISGIVALPGILSSLKPWQELGAYWVPQIVASCCFLTAAILFTIETQETIYNPKLRIIGWWVGSWATVGSVGFHLSACFGVPSNAHSWCEYQSDLSSLWGSAAYLISSVLQWYESVNKGPVLAFPNMNVADFAVQGDLEKELET